MLEMTSVRKVKSCGCCRSSSGPQPPGSATATTSATISEDRRQSVAGEYSRSPGAVRPRPSNCRRCWPCQQQAERRARVRTVRSRGTSSRGSGLFPALLAVPLVFGVLRHIPAEPRQVLGEACDVGRDRGRVQAIGKEITVEISSVAHRPVTGTVPTRRVPKDGEPITMDVEQRSYCVPCAARRPLVPDRSAGSVTSSVRPVASRCRPRGPRRRAARQRSRHAGRLSWAKDLSSAPNPARLCVGTRRASRQGRRAGAMSRLPPEKGRAFSVNISLMRGRAFGSASPNRPSNFVKNHRAHSVSR